IYCEHHSCHHDGHPLMLPSIYAYELHYEAKHLNTCSVCEKVFPSSHWLQLHLDEFHDVLKKIQKERGEKIYACYVEGCQKRFIDPRLRRLHLIDKHHYPKYFPFDIVLTG
ncbi:C2H2-type zinc finger transcription factor, partial [Phycomyces blakesleeanus NRRL 1555(-)]